MSERITVCLTIADRQRCEGCQFLKLRKADADDAPLVRFECLAFGEWLSTRRGKCVRLPECLQAVPTQTPTDGEQS